MNNNHQGFGTNVPNNYSTLYTNNFGASSRIPSDIDYIGNTTINATCNIIGGNFSTPFLSSNNTQFDHNNRQYHNHHLSQQQQRQVTLQNRQSDGSDLHQRRVGKLFFILDKKFIIIYTSL